MDIEKSVGIFREINALFLQQRGAQGQDHRNGEDERRQLGTELGIDLILLRLIFCNPDAVGQHANSMPLLWARPSNWPPTAVTGYS